MNELILKRLAEESGFLNDVTKFEAFAVLLVKECASVLDQEIAWSVDRRGDYVAPDLILNNHFGITE